MSEHVSSIAEAGFCESLTRYVRRATIEVPIGDVPVGGDNPIRVQSMTTVDTMDTKGSVEQSIRMIEAGCEYVRITAPSIREAENLRNIKGELRKMGYRAPLVADIHFTPNAAEIAARIVEKVRINPGNYADKKKFEIHRYTKATYAAELDRIRERFVPLVRICKEYGTAMRIGTNHGSLSDRIMSRYGDTPLGMVESALEFLRICEDERFYSIVLSMKASNPQIMVQAYRLLVQKLNEEGLKPYPLHLGVTEAGEAEDGRIKSALGIGTLLEDGLGDTIRVSLTEEPEHEIPVALALAKRYDNRIGHTEIPPVADFSGYKPYSYVKDVAHEVGNIGGGNLPRVVTDVRGIQISAYSDLECVGHFYLPEPDKFRMNDHGTDYIYTGDSPVPFMLPNGLKEIVDYTCWTDAAAREERYPLLSAAQYLKPGQRHPALNFVEIDLASAGDALLHKLRSDRTAVLVLATDNAHGMAEQRTLALYLRQNSVQAPMIIMRQYSDMDVEQVLLHASTDIGALLIDGYGDGIFVQMQYSKGANRAAVSQDIRKINGISFGILQAARLRMTKTEYISCPSCGRTLFDLQETTAKIRKRTDHLKGVKIGIMGCIVNGPGEMADADYGYVGSGKGKITLYRGKEIVRRGVPSAEAVDALIELIREDGNWIENTTTN
jgi:(E)-4-hydroxy-3-methylbut-2-enyl-diphosphate synthase